MMPFGSVFSKFPFIRLTTADGRKIYLKNSFVSRVALKLIGFPHIELRLRARMIFKNLPKEKKQMLDAGSGSGIYSFSLAQYIQSITAIDLESDKIDYAKSINIFNNINFSVGDLCCLKQNDESFDLIICSDVIEHIKDDRKDFSELARVLKKAGTLLITVPYDSKRHRKGFGLLHHERPGYKKEQLESLCRECGLTLLKSEVFLRNTTGILSKYIDTVFVGNKIVMSLLFYPVYLYSIISDAVFDFSEPNGLFCKITK